MSTVSKSILIVDDAATVRMYHRDILEKVGFTVDEAYNGIEALEKALNARYDLFLVDVNMPKKNGYEFVRDLRLQDIDQAPVLMISTEAEQHDRDLAFEAGANFYLIKPLKPESLLLHCRLLLGMAGDV